MYHTDNYVVIINQALYIPPINYVVVIKKSYSVGLLAISSIVSLGTLISTFAGNLNPWRDNNGGISHWRFC
jgi:hypothetical protein